MTDNNTTDEKDTKPQEHLTADDKITKSEHGEVKETLEDKPPRGVSNDMWKKFQELKKRRLEMTSKSTAKRMKQMKSDILEKVSKELNPTEEVSTLQSDSMNPTKASTSTLEEDERSQTEDPSQKPEPSSSQVSDHRERWCEVKPYLGINEHLKGVDPGKYAPKTKLEEKIDKAIAEGDFKTAEELSDHLSTREFGKKVADAFDAKKYDEQKKKIEEAKAAKRKKKLNWGFEHKQRWETKGNM